MAKSKQRPRPRRGRDGLSPDFAGARRNAYPVLYALAGRARPTNSSLNPKDFDEAEAFEIMKDNISKLDMFLKPHTYESLQALDDIERMGILGYLKIIGEKSRHISQSTAESFPTVPWRPLKDIRNALAHNMSSFTSDDIWKKISNLLIDEFPVMRDEVVASANEYAARLAPPKPLRSEPARAKPGDLNIVA